MNSRLEQMIAEIEQYIENCKYQTLSKTMISVNKEELLELLDELSRKTPDEIRTYQKIINNRDAILQDAREKADEMIAQAQIQANEMVTQHSIMLQATAQANEVVTIASNQAQEILDNATTDADNLRTAAAEYTDNLLANFESLVVNAIDTTKARYEALNNSFQEFYEVVKANRAELNPVEEPEVYEANTGRYDPNQINLI